MLICHRNGKIISSPPSSSTRCVPQRRGVCVAVRDVAVRGVEGVLVRSLIVDPPLLHAELEQREHADDQDRKSTRLNSSHVSISYAVFCLKKKKGLGKRAEVIWSDAVRI